MSQTQLLVCDRCNLTERADETDDLAWNRHRIEEDQVIDLCPRCSDLFARFMNGLTIRAEKQIQKRDRWWARVP